MSDFSLVPVDHQPEFADVSLIPVDHNPFSADSSLRANGTQPELQQQSSGFSAASPVQVGLPAIDTPAAVFGRSSDPDFASRFPNQIEVQKLTASPISPPSGSTYDWRTHYQPLGELKAATYTPTQRIESLATDALMGLGMKPYIANDLTSRVGNLLGLTPLGVVGSALDLIDAKRRDDLPGAVSAAAGMIPGAKRLGAQKAGNVAREITLSRSVHGEAAAHAADAIDAGHPRILTINRPGSYANRRAATGKLDKVAGKDLDEYPGAMFREGGDGADVRAINRKHNRSGGASVGNSCRGLPNEARIKIIIGD